MTTVHKPSTDQTTTLPYRLALNIRALEMTEDQFLQLCSDNGDLRMELTANRELIIMPPNGFRKRLRKRANCLFASWANWAKQDGTGRAFGPNAGYTLPNGAVRAPDASWMPLSRWESLSRDDQTKFGHTFPDFTIELRSPSDRAVRRAGQDDGVSGKRRPPWVSSSTPGNGGYTSTAPVKK